MVFEIPPGKQETRTEVSVGISILVLQVRTTHVIDM
jgi:hypothetical protein